MANRHLQPPGLFDSQPLGFSQAVVSYPGDLVFVSGQVAWDEELQLVGGADLAAQAAQALANLARALVAAGAKRSDVSSIRIYIVDYEPAFARIVGPKVAEFFGTPPPASTLIGVQALAAPGLLIEIEAIAVVSA